MASSHNITAIYIYMCARQSSNYPLHAKNLASESNTLICLRSTNDAGICVAKAFD